LRRIPLAIKLAARDERNKQRKDPSRYIDEVWLKGAPAAAAETVRRCSAIVEAHAIGDVRGES
jgi:hypothetical protein